MTINLEYWKARPWLIKDGKFPARWLRAFNNRNHRERMAEVMGENALLKTLLKAAKARQ